MIIKDAMNTFVFYKNNLPHYQHNDSPIFITWRLAFPIPQLLLETYIEKRKQFDKEINKSSELDERELANKYNKAVFDLFDSYMANDKSLPDTLIQKDISNVVKHTLHCRDAIDYKLMCYCIMPNHVHTLIQPINDSNGKFKLIPEITKAWKGVSARRINKILSVQGQLWQHESYDHVVRNEKEFNNIVLYILNNPVKAGLVDDWQYWENTYVSPEIMKMDDYP
jgi:putative transposase